MRIDAHQHFWKFDPIQYEWITDEMKIIRRDFAPGETPLRGPCGFYRSPGCACNFAAGPAQCTRQSGIGKKPARGFGPRGKSQLWGEDALNCEFKPRRCGREQRASLP